MENRKVSCIYKRKDGPAFKTHYDNALNNTLSIKRTQMKSIKRQRVLLKSYYFPENQEVMENRKASCIYKQKDYVAFETAVAGFCPKMRDFTHANNTQITRK